MCGIFCLLFPGDQSERSLTYTAQELLSKSRVHNRGPDRTSHTCACTGEFGLYLQGFVLHLRGQQITTQPRITASGNQLVWNGEIFGGVQMGDDENDTAWLADRLDQNEDQAAVLDVLSSIHGPWAMVFYQKRSGKLWFGRDILGRRSLLWKPPCLDHLQSIDSQIKNALIITSTAIEGLNLQELPTDGLYCLNLTSFEITLHPWDRTPSGVERVNSMQHDFDVSEQTMKSSLIYDTRCEYECPRELSSNLEELFSAVCDRRLRERDMFERLLSEAVRRRVVCQSSLCGRCIEEKLRRGGEVDVGDSKCGHARVGVLFSGGIDSMVIAALAHRHVPRSEPIDLLNVAFETKGKGAVHHKKNKNKMKKCNVAADTEITPRNVRNDVDVSNNDVASSSCDDVKVGDDRSNYMVPDRLTGLAAWRELQALYPDRKWMFYNVNVTGEQLATTRDEHIRHLVSPLQTVLDDSIGCAVWFAARGRGLLQSPDGIVEQGNSTARVLLLGMGADEQLGGYARHRNAFRNGGYDGLDAELSMEIDRISGRNLGRDDRIVSDHGKEARFPFLDENVVGYLNQLPCHYKADLSLPRGYGEKLLLRHLAHKLALKSCIHLPKRAIQFGSRIAKLEDSNERASDTCDRLQSKE